jgi:hypothetical protein
MSNFDSFAIDVAILAVIEAASILPAAHENGGTASRPYLDIQQATVTGEVRSMAGGNVEIEYGSYSVAVVVNEGTGSRAAKGYVDQVIALFPNGLRLPFSGGVVTIGGRGDVCTSRRTGFNAQAEYRVPVVIPYIARAT